MRRLTILFVIAALCAAAEPAFAANQVRAPGNFGIGIGAGTFATGVSLKYFMDAKMAVQGNIGWWRGPVYRYGDWRYGGHGSLALSADLIWHMPSFAGNQAVKVAWNLGGGVGLGVDDLDNELGLGATFVIALELDIDVAPIDVVLEYRPGIYFLPDVFFDGINFSGHIRYFF